jgi:MFS family permease
MKTALILVAGIVTDRIGGASSLLWGNAIFSIGAILIAAATTVRSYEFMIFGIIVQALGDIATQVAQYKVFSSWFAPSDGFASTLGLELGIGKIGSFVGKATANVIAKKTGDFSWVYWTAVFMNLFTNVVTLGFWFFTKWCSRTYSGMVDPATGEKLTENNKKFEFRKMLRLPWTFWGVVCFSLFQTSTALIYLVPLIGVFVDVFGNRLTLMVVCSTGMLLSMCLAAWGPTIGGTAASFGIYAVAVSFGPTVIIDSVRTSMWYQEVFGSGYAVKIAVNNCMTIFVRIITGIIQDRDNNSYDNVVKGYVFLSAGSVVVGTALLVGSYWTVDLKLLQWTKKERMANGEVINERRVQFEEGEAGVRNRKISMTSFILLIFFILGAWAAYFWGVATGHNK